MIQKQVEKIFLDRGLEIREHSIKNIIGDYISPSLPHVVAVGTAGGKTTITAAKLEFLYSNNLIKQDEYVLISAADKTILRENFESQFDDFFKEIPASFKYRQVKGKKQLKKAVEDGIQVIIALPQSLNSTDKLNLLSGMKFKWFIQDEAHHWYFRPTIQKIIRYISPDHQVLLTGTPFKFNMKNKISKKPQFIIDYTSVRELYEKGYLSDFTAQVLHSDIALTKANYVQMLGNLISTKRLSKSDLEIAFDSVINQIIKKLKLPFKDLATTHNITSNMASVFGKLEKTIIFAHGIPEADYFTEHLRQNKVKAIVTHSKTGIPSDVAFDLFKNDPEVKVLVAVNQGKEGFDFPELYNVIDMTFSQNFEVVMQIIGRILRKSKNIPNKYFFKVAPKNTAGYFVDWMNALFMLFDEEWYSKFDGKNGFDIQVPNTLINRKKKKKRSKRKGTSTSPRKPGSFKPNNLDSFNSLEFMSKNKWFKMNDRLSTVATTSLKRIYDLHNAEKPLEEFKQDLILKQDKESKPKSTKFIDPNDYLKSIRIEKNKPERKSKNLEQLKKLFKI